MSMSRRLHIGDAHKFFLFLLASGGVESKLDYFCGRCYARFSRRCLKDTHYSCGGEFCLLFAVGHYSFSRRTVPSNFWSAKGASKNNSPARVACSLRLPHYQAKRLEAEQRQPTPSHPIVTKICCRECSSGLYTKIRYP